MIRLLPLLLLLHGSLRGQDPEFTTVTLNVGQTVDEIVTEDLDGDGFRDLIIQSGKDLRIFLYRKGFKPEPDQTIRLDANVFLWHLAHIGDKRSWSIVTHSSRGLHRYAWANGAFSARPEDLVIHPNMFEGNAGESRPPLFVDFTPDLNRDGLSDLLLFREREMFVFRHQEGGGFKLKQKLPIPMDVQTDLPFGIHQKASEVRHVPMIVFGDQSISLYHEEKLEVFDQQKDGRFAPARTIAFSSKSQEPASGFINWDIPPILGDLNGDGLLDAALCYPNKGRVHLFYGRTGRTDFTEPDEVKKFSRGWITGMWTIRRDGKSDLIIGLIEEIGLFSALRIFTTGKVELQLHVFRMESNGRYAAEPAQVLKFEIPITFQVTREAASGDFTFTPNLDADINGDGLKDMIVAGGANTLLVYYGDKARGFDDKPGGKIAMSPPDGTLRTDLFAADFNADGRSDLVLKHVGVGERCLALEVKLSK